MIIIIYMPYNNEYNRMIADDIMRLNQKYVEHDRKTGEGMSGGFLGALAGMLLPTVVSGVSKLFGGAQQMPAAFYEYGDASTTGGAMCGGEMPPASGFADGTFRDTGFGSVEGAGSGNMEIIMEEMPKKKGRGRSGAGVSGGVAMYKKRGRPRKMHGGTLLGIPSAVLENNLGPSGLVGAGNAMVGGAIVPVANMKSSSMAGGAMQTHSMDGGAMLHPLLTVELPKSKAAANKAIRETKKLMKSMAKHSGAGVSGAGRSGAGVSGAGVSGAGRSGAGVSGGGRAARAAIVKKVMADKGLSMIEASKYVKAHNLYKK